MTAAERKRRSRERNKQLEPTTTHRDPLHLKPSAEANELARKLHEFTQRLELELLPWFEREDVPEDDLEILRYALNSGVDILGTWSTELWMDEEQ